MKHPRWPHQAYALSETIRRIQAGVRSICISSPTGGGKATIAGDILKTFVEWGWDCALFTNRRLLTSQISKSLSDSGIHLGVRAADFESWSDPTAPVQVCSFQTEDARVLRKREQAIRRARSEQEAHRDHQLFPAKAIVIDELHDCTGEVASAIVREYQEKWNAVVIGLSATPLGCSGICDELVIAGNNSQLRACGALVPFSCWEPASFDIWKVRRVKSGIYSQADMEEKVKAIWSQAVVGQIVGSWKEHNPDSKPSLGFAPGVAESLGLAMEFQKQGINAAHISADGIYVDGKQFKTTLQEDRENVFAMLKDGRVKICWNRFVLRTAIDLPFVECISLATPIADIKAYLQTCGRGGRASPSTGKTSCTLLDHGGAIRMHGNPNEDRDTDWEKFYYRDSDAITKERISKLRDPDCNEPEPITCPECGKMRSKGPKCQNCGHEHTKSTRRVIQEDGKLKLTKGDVFPKRRVSVKPDTASKVERAYHRCKNARKPLSFNQMRGLLKKEERIWVPMDLPFFPKNKADFSRKIKDVPACDLIQKGQ